MRDSAFGDVGNQRFGASDIRQLSSWAYYRNTRTAREVVSSPIFRSEKKPEETPTQRLNLCVRFKFKIHRLNVTG